MRFLRWILYVALFGAGFLLGLYLLIRISFAGTTTLVPMVVGLTKEQAEWQADRARLRYMVKGERYDLKAPRGLVVEQIPAAGMNTRRGTSLAVVVSKGVEKLDVPGLLGMRVDQAQLQIPQTGLRLLNTSYVHDRALPNTVIGQEPPPGTVVPRDSDVQLLVSLGPTSPTFVMPNLVGKPAGRSQLQLQGYGIQVGAPRLVRGAGAAPETIVNQSPGPGAPLRRTDVVILTVSSP